MTKMQRSHSMHVNLSVEDLEAAPSSSAIGVTAATGRLNGTSIPRSASVGIPRSASGVTVLDILDPRSYPMEKGKRVSRFQSENCIHLIPFVLLICYLCLWIGSSEVPVSGDEFARRAMSQAKVPAEFGPSGSQVNAHFEERVFVVERQNNTLNHEPVD